MWQSDPRPQQSPHSPSPRAKTPGLPGKKPPRGQSLCKQQESKGLKQDSEGRKKTILENAVKHKKPQLGREQLLAWAGQREPASLPSPGTLEGLWCFVWTLMTEIQNPLPYDENIFAD